MKENFGIKFLSGTARVPRSPSNNSPWRIGEWREVDGAIVPCHNGFHCTQENGFGYWSDWGTQVFVVEFSGVTVTQDDGGSSEKIAAQKMRLVKKLPITKKFLADLAKAFGVKVKAGYTRSDILEVIWWDGHMQNEGLERSVVLAQAVLQEYAPEYL
jgi:hypothetical protein